MELMVSKIHEQNTDDQNIVTQFVLLTDMSGFTLRQHACTVCLAEFLGAIRDYEAYYPRLLHKILRN